MKNYFLCFIGWLSCSMAFAQLDTYEYKQELKGISGQWHSIELPNSVFANIAFDLSDIRIFGVTENDTLEAPYILKVASGKRIQRRVNFALLNTASNSSGHYFTYEIPTTEAINEIQLDFNNQNFDWRIVLEGSQDQQEWFTILDDYRILSIKTDQTDYTFSALNFPATKYRYYRLLVKSGEKPELLSAKLSFDGRTNTNYSDFPITFMNIEQVAKNTILDIDLKQRLPLSHLKLNVSNEIDYYRPISIQYVSDSVETEKGWKYSYANLASGTLTSIAKKGFQFETTLAQKLRVIIENYDNRPLQIESAKAKGYIHELVARFSEPATYYLTYGNDQTKKPYYDIVQAATKIPDNLSRLTLRDVQEIPKKAAQTGSPLFENKLWLWGVMGLVILVLGWFTVRMMGKR